MDQMEPRRTSARLGALGKARTTVGDANDRRSAVEAMRAAVVEWLGVSPDAFDVDSDCARGQGAGSGGGHQCPGLHGTELPRSSSAGLIDATKASQSLPAAGSADSQIPICCGEPSLTMTADQVPGGSPGIVLFSVVPPRTRLPPSWAAHAGRTVWVPARNVVTAEPDTLSPTATASTSVVAGAPSTWYCTEPPNAPLGLAVADATGAGAEAEPCVGAALGAAAQPATMGRSRAARATANTR